MAPKIDPNTMTSTQIAAARRNWADYIRLRNKPTKTCPRCSRAFPNTQEYFAITLEGRIMRYCVECAGEQPTAPAAAALQPCPLCRTLAQLVRDRASPQRMDVCWTCLRVANALSTMPHDTLHRIARYVDWRRQEKTPPEGGV